MHHVARADDIRLEPSSRSMSVGFARCSLVEGEAGSVHMGLGLCALEPSGRIDVHSHSFEEGFYVLEGSPTIVLGDRGCRLRRGVAGVVPVGTPHAWIGGEAGEARWVDMLAPQPRREGSPLDTFFLGPLGIFDIAEFDRRDPRFRQLAGLDERQLVPGQLKADTPAGAPAVPAAMAGALRASGGIAIEMLVDRARDAQLLTMFIVEYEPGAVLEPHDHPFEEAYAILVGEVEALADGARYTLRAGDVLWTSVGCIHAFRNTNEATVRWLETQAPQPPASHAFRFDGEWPAGL